MLDADLPREVQEPVDGDLGGRSRRTERHADARIRVDEHVRDVEQQIAHAVEVHERVVGSDADRQREVEVRARGVEVQQIDRGRPGRHQVRERDGLIGVEAGHRRDARAHLIRVEECRVDFGAETDLAVVDREAAEAVVAHGRGDATGAQVTVNVEIDEVNRQAVRAEPASGNGREIAEPQRDVGPEGKAGVESYRQCAAQRADVAQVDVERLGRRPTQIQAKDNLTVRVNAGGIRDLELGARQPERRLHARLERIELLLR